MSNKSLLQHWEFLHKDPLGELNFCINKFWDVVYAFVTTIICRLRLLFGGGGDYGNNLRVRGIMTIRRFQCSTISVGDRCTFNSSSRFNARGINHKCILETGKPGALLKIGNHCGFSGCSIVADKEVIIGDHVMVGANTCIGDRDDHPDRLGTSPQPVHIGNNVFIGMHCIVMKGVTIGDNSIIGAGSIVTKDIPANCIAAGVPCKVIRQKV